MSDDWRTIREATTTFKESPSRSPAWFRFGAVDPYTGNVWEVYHYNPETQEVGLEVFLSPGLPEDRLYHPPLPVLRELTTKLRRAERRVRRGKIDADRSPSRPQRPQRRRSSGW